MDDAALERFADLAVGFGANVQPGQIVAVECEPGKDTWSARSPPARTGTGRGSST